jgi:hypothetical protein
LPREADQIMALVEKGAAALLTTSPLLRQRLEVLIRQATVEVTEAQSSVLALQHQVEQWFDDTMEHVTGWYKRNRQWAAFAIGLVIALLLNIDTLDIGITLWNQPALREALTAAAQEIGASGLPNAGATDPGTTVSQIEATLASLKIPIGWREAPKGMDILVKAAGILFTALMAMQGAPFWFDLLDKVIPIRAAGAPPRKAEDQPVAG